MPKCLVCGKTAIHYFCSVSCSHKYDEINYPEKKCLSCGKQLYHDGLSEADYLKRKFCSRKCAAHYKRGQKIEIVDTVKIKNVPSNVIATLHRRNATILVKRDKDIYYWVGLFKNGTVLSSNKFDCIEKVYADIAMAF